MQTALIIIGITSASLAGSAFGYWSLEQVEQRKLRTSYLLQAGAAAERQALGYLHVRGLARTVIEVAMASSDEQDRSKLVQAPLWYLRSNTLERLMKKAGLGGELSIEGCARARMKLALSLAIAGLVCGMLASEMLALIGCLVGFIVGYRAPQTRGGRARQRRRTRAFPACRSAGIRAEERAQFRPFARTVLPLFLVRIEPCLQAFPGSMASRLLNTRRRLARACRKLRFSPLRAGH